MSTLDWGPAELWVDRAGAAVDFYAAAFGAAVLHRVGEGDDIVGAGARQFAAVNDEHGWLLGRIVDPFGHEWEIGRPLGEWPPS